jgi:hypothetical protein
MPMTAKDLGSDFPAPSAYRQSVPAGLPPPTAGIETPRAARRRWIKGLAVVVVLHASAALAWWLTPPLRLKTSPAPDRWVQVSSLPQKEPEKRTPAPVNVPQPAHPGVKSRKSHQSGAPLRVKPSVVTPVAVQ